MTVTAMPPSGEETDEGGGKRKGKKVKVVALLLVVGIAAAYFFLLKPGPSTPAEPVEGEVMTMAEPIQINLQGGHYLKVGVAVQLTDQAKEADPSRAVDAVIETFSARQLSDLTQPEQREKAKAELLKVIKERYHGEVMEVYFTDFVTQ